MNREALKAMGLTDEQVESVMKEHGKSVNELKEQANEVDTLKAQNEDLTKQLTARDEQLEELKKVDAEGLKAKIGELQTANEATKTEYEEKLHKQAFEFKLREALTDAKVRNPKAVQALLDVESIKLDGDKLLNLDSQLEALKESDAYLFEQENTPGHKPNFTIGNHAKGSGALTKEQIMQETDNIKRQQLIKQNSHLFK